MNQNLEPEPSDRFNKAAWEMFWRIVENCPIAVFATDAAGRLVFVNETWSTLTGLPGQQAVGLRLDEILQPEDVDTVSNHWRQLVTYGDALVLRIRLAGADEPTRPAAILHTVESFPQDGHRRFIGTLTPAPTLTAGTVAPYSADRGDLDPLGPALLDPPLLHPELFDLSRFDLDSLDTEPLDTDSLGAGPLDVGPLDHDLLGDELFGDLGPFTEDRAFGPGALFDHGTHDHEPADGPSRYEDPADRRNGHPLGHSANHPAGRRLPDPGSTQGPTAGQEQGPGPDAVSGDPEQQWSIPLPRRPVPGEPTPGRPTPWGAAEERPPAYPRGALPPGAEWRAAVVLHRDEEADLYPDHAGRTGSGRHHDDCGCMFAEMRRIEDACRDRERWLTTLLAELSTAVLIADRDCAVVAVNQLYCDLFDLAESPVDLVGTDCRRHLRPRAGLVDDPSGFAARLDTLLRRRRTLRREPVMFADGRFFERSHITLAAGDGYRGHLWLYSDVTDRRILEAEIEGLISGL
ncbi:PAS domain-containing protein [Frankia sp. R82]|uniref:PAS domain-containing protein n=1 Tax=Frankia sp. R82 TaxID=2950553 RepID=UPI0020436901|nr:PAS domain-containing protein [Frankia sp. R82]MCM3886754.1 PAS domain-containing protein [Frankia sp. R82]